MSLLTPSLTYKPFRYPWAFEAFNLQNKLLWLPEEVPLGDDVNDWHHKLSDNEKNLLTQIFRFFTQADVGVHEAYSGSYKQIFQPIEIQMMMSAFENMEAIHISAYSHLLDTVGMPESEYEAFLKYKEMKDKWDYMHTFSVETPSDIARKLAAFGGGIEGLALFASFAILLSFPRRNRMKGMGQIITWSMRDETLHCLSILRLFHTFLAEHPEIWNGAFQLELCHTFGVIMSHEKAFVHLAYEMGDVDGLDKDDVYSYIDYLANRRLIQLGVSRELILTAFSHETPKHNPLPWLDEMMGAIEQVNFFEARATEYTKAMTEGTWEEAYESAIFGDVCTLL